jgi:DNA-nicking Smr family endonuclease
VSRRRDDEPDWARGLGDVRPLRDREKRHAPTAPEPGAAPQADAAPVPFEVERRGELLLGRAPGIDREQLRRLRRGRVQVDETLDLHGLDATAAEHALQQTLQSARETGARCLLVVHGRGVHSKEGAVLKEALVDWLAAPPIGHQVMAFASATPEDGGTGATYVLLRRTRR